MSFLSRWRIGRRLSLAFAVVVALTLVSAVFIQVRMNDVERFAHEAAVDQQERTALVFRWHEDTAVNANRAQALGMVTDPVLAESLNSKMKATSQEISGLQKRIEVVETTPAGVTLQAHVGEVRKRYLAQREALMQAHAGGSSIAAAIATGEALTKFNALCEEYVAAIDKMVDYERQRTQAGSAQISAALDGARLISVACAVISIVLSIGLGVALTRSIVAPVQAAQKAADRIAAGDLTGDCRSVGTDEAAQLVTSLGKMQDALKRIVNEIRNSTEQMQVASTEVASGNQDLSARTEQTAGSLQQAASSMDELTSTIRHSADAANQAHGLANSASEIATRGGRVVSQVVSTMDEINASSKKISDIIGVIDGIAFQTNILALNAAVEAARAGEQGRGFAVVAGEVRSLAQRSAEAAKEIKTLIGASVDKVESGARLVQDAGSTMQEIVGAVRRVSEVLGEITTAASEQAGGIQLVNEAVNNVDQMTQQNAALVEESAAAAESMRDQAGKLAKTVEQFRTS
jgi:methyl-accepting chemotaxis protein